LIAQLCPFERWPLAAGNGNAVCTTSTRPASPNAIGGQDGSSWLIVLKGDVDVACRDCLRVEFERARNAGDRVVLDASGVTFLDGGGLRALLSAAVCCDEVWLRSPSDSFRRVAEITGLWDEWDSTASDAGRRIR
jgi:anti-anti-sigma factor